MKLWKYDWGIHYLKIELPQVPLLDFLYFSFFWEIYGVNFTQGPCPLICKLLVATIEFVREWVKILMDN